MGASRATTRAPIGLSVATQVMGGLVLCGAVMSAMWPGHAFAADPSITIPPGHLADGQTIVVSGAGFSNRVKDPSGLQIIECADPQGLKANLPTDASTCEGTTINSLPVNTDSSGRFSVRYRISALTTRAGTSGIDCDASHFCVLWVGQDYNQAFTTGPHAFSSPFEVEASVSTSPGGSGPSPQAGATSPGGPGGTLASTGPPHELPWLIGLGLVLVVAGTTGRRRIRAWSRDEKSPRTEFRGESVRSA
jgi:hypothetical protein